MNHHPNHAAGRVGVAALVVLVLLAIALYLYSERAAPPEPPATPAPVATRDDDAGRSDRQAPDDLAPETGSGSRLGVGDEDHGFNEPAARPGEGVPSSGLPVPDAAPEPVELDEAGARLRVQLAERTDPADLELLVSTRLIERVVAIVHSLDGDPLPLRFRPLAHVAGLPRVVESGEGVRLPDAPDPRYDRYRALFERFDAETLARLFRRHEAAFEQAWRALGESSELSFRERLVDVLDHLASFRLPAERPALVRPEVLYEYADPALEELSWGRKIMLRVGPAHAEAIRARARALADALRGASEASAAGTGAEPDRR